MWEGWFGRKETKMTILAYGAYKLCFFLNNLFQIFIGISWEARALDRGNCKVLLVNLDKLYLLVRLIKALFFLSKYEYEMKSPKWKKTINQTVRRCEMH